MTTDSQSTSPYGVDDYDDDLSETAADLRSDAREHREGPLPNRLRTLLRAIAGDERWPWTLDASDLDEIDRTTAALTDRVHDLNDRLPEVPLGRKATRMIRWVGEAFEEARELLHLAAVPLASQTGKTLRTAVAAALLWHKLYGLVVSGPASVVDHQELSRRARGCARWIGLARAAADGPVADVDVLALLREGDVVVPPGFRYFGVPVQEQDAGIRYHVERRYPERKDPSTGWIDRVLIEAEKDGPLTITMTRRRDGGPVTGEITLDLLELCLLMSLKFVYTEDRGLHEE